MSSSRPNRFSRPNRTSTLPASGPIYTPSPGTAYNPGPSHPHPPRPTRTSTLPVPGPPSSRPSTSSTAVPFQPKETLSHLLSRITASLTSTLNLFSLADKSHFGPDEAEQIHALESVLSTSAADLRTLTALVGGGMYLAASSNPDTLSELRALCRKFDAHEALFRDWVRTGGAINPLWVRETRGLGRELHRTLCRGARRVFVGEREGAEEGAVRCLGAWVVYRAIAREREREERERAVWREGKRRGSLEGVVPECNSVGRFERFGEGDVAFVCDYCDGFLVWKGIGAVPSCRRVEGREVDGYPNWAAVGRRSKIEDDGGEEEKVVVFAPLVIANHVPPRHGEWMARVLCSYCEEYTYIDQGDEGGAERKWVTDQDGFESVDAFQEHLQWTHTALPRPAIPFVRDGKCVVM